MASATRAFHTRIPGLPGRCVGRYGRIHIYNGCLRFIFSGIPSGFDV